MMQDKISIDRAEFILLLKSCLPGVDTSKTALQGADTFVFHEGRLLAYNDWLGISRPCGFNLSFNVEAALLLKFMAAIKAKQVALWLDDNKLWVDTGSSQMALPVRVNKNAQRYQSILPEAPIWRNLPKGFFKAMECALLPGSDKFSGIYASGNLIVAGGDNDIAIQDIDGNLEKFWISNKVAKVLLQYNEAFQYNVHNSWLHFECGNGLMFSCHKLNDESYPIARISQIVEIWKAAEVVGSGELSKDTDACLKEAALVSGLGEEGQKLVWFSVSEGKLGISSHSKSGNYESAVTGVYNGDGKKIGVNVDRLLLARKNGAKFFELRVSGKNTAMILQYGSGYLFTGTTTA